MPRDSNYHNTEHLCFQVCKDDKIWWILADEEMIAETDTS